MSGAAGYLFSERTMMEPLFARDYPIRLDEADCTGRVTPVALLNYLQDAAYRHADAIGVGVPFLRQRRLAWVLSRYFVRFFHYPKVLDIVQVRTWPSTRDERFTARDYEILGPAGEPVAAATSSWALLNFASRRPVPLAEHLPDYPLRPQRSAEFPPDKISLPDVWDGETAFPVRRSDLDINRHVNHTVYVGWALESLPAAVVDGHRLGELDIAYRAEALDGDTVRARWHRLPAEPTPAFLQQLVHAGDGREFARLRTRFQPVARAKRPLTG